jgi:hypothetical protein
MAMNCAELIQLVVIIIAVTPTVATAVAVVVDDVDGVVSILPCRGWTTVLEQVFSTDVFRVAPG